MSRLLAGMAALLLLAAPLEEARAQNAPTVTAVTFESFPKSGDTFKRGEEIRQGVTFSEAVVVTGTPRIKVWLQSRVYRWADYNAALSEGSRLTFVYTVQAGDLSDGIFGGWGGWHPLSLNGGTIKSADGLRDADLTYGFIEMAWWLVSRRAAVKVDGSQVDDSASAAPTAQSVRISSTPAEGDTYKLGEKLSVAMDFDGDVAVKGVPVILLVFSPGSDAEVYSERGLSAQWANYDGALSTARRLVFSYTVQESDYAKSFVAGLSSSSISLNGGAVRSQADERDANIHRLLTFSGNAGGKVNGLLGVSTPTVPVVTGVRILAPKNGDTFELQETIWGYISFAPAVKIWGTYLPTPDSPHLALTIGTQTRRVPVHPTGSGKIGFAYTVQDGDRDMDGLSIAANALTTGRKGTIVHAHPHVLWRASANLSLGSHIVSNDARYKVDGGGGTSPGGGNPEPGLRVSAIRFTGTPASGVTYRLGEQIQAAVTFTEAVTVTGTPQLGLTIGTQTRQAVYDATRSKGTLVGFTYYVQATDTDADGISIAANALTLNGGTITRASNTATAAALAHAGVGTDDTRKVDGSTDVVEHGNSREQATLLVLSARTTGGVGETGNDDDFRVNVAAEQSAEVAGALEQAGDGDYFRVEVAEAGRLTVETTGATDTVGALQGATGQTLTEDDDGGTETNFRVERQVQAGTYYVAVTGGDSEPGVGLYTLAVRFTPVGGGTSVENVVPAPRDSPPAAGGAAGAGAEQSRPATLRVNTETRGRLEQAGEVDYFRVAVQAAGTVMVEASGAAAPVAYFGAGNGPLLPQEAGGRAAQAAWPVTAGTYHVAVVGGATRTQTGAYTVAVRFTAASEAGPLRATLLNLAPAQAWVHFYCGREQDAEAAACMAQVQCGLQDGAPVAWDVEVAPERIVSYWPGRTAADGTSANFEAALVAAGRPEAEAGQRTTCRVFSPDPLEVRAYTRIGQDVVPVAQSSAPLDATAPTRVATLLNVAPAHALVHLSCRKAPAAAGEPADPCQARLQCGQQEGTPVAWEVTVAAETTMTYGPGGTSDDLATALVTAGKTEAEARRRTTCQVFSRDPLDAWAYTRVGGDLVSVTNPPAAVDAAAPTRVATLLNMAPAQAWVHFYCRKAHDPAAETVDPCTVRLQCGQQAGAPVAWDVPVAPETIVTYWPGRTTDDGTSADFAAALVAAGKTEAEARRRTTCQVFSTDPVDVRGYTQVGGTVVPVANPPVMPAADAPPTRIGTLLNLSPAQAWVHFYCRKAHQPEAETADPCTVQLQCGQRDGTSVGWDVAVAPETIMSYWPGRTAAGGTSDDLAAALVAAGKTEAEARRRTTCQVFSADPVDVRGYTQLGEMVVPVKN